MKIVFEIKKLILLNKVFMMVISNLMIKLKK